MNDLTKNKIHRFLKRIGLRVSKERYYRFFPDADNYSEVLADMRLNRCYCPVIFDVGANIGQTSLWYAKEFSTATIYAFEPIKRTFHILSKNTHPYSNRIKSFNVALGDSCDIQDILLRSNNPYSQENSLLRSTNNVENGETETIHIITFDSFVIKNEIQKIDILKTDTEGYDLKVLKGAIGALKEHRVRNIISEATFRECDSQHTQFWELMAFLEGFGFYLFSLYDLNHSSSGELLYFNAHFKLVE